MHLTKEISTPYGVTASCHEIIAIHVYAKEKITHLDVAGYASDESRTSGAEPLTVVQLTFNQGDYLNEAAAYRLVLTEKGYENAVLTEVIVDGDTQAQG